MAMDGKEMLAQLRAETAKRQNEAAERYDAGIAAVHRLVGIAKSDTGQSGRVASFLLAWWNAATCGSFDLTDIWAVDAEIADDMITVLRFVADRREYPPAFGLREDFEQIIARWRPELLKH